MGAELGVIGLIATAIGAGYSAWSSNQAGKEQAANIKAQAKMSANQQLRQAEEAKEQMEAQARAYDRQSLSALLEANENASAASEELRQGEISQEKANIEQMKGEREAAKRSRLLAHEIGEQYAQFAGNGFDVAASPTDTFGSIIKSSVTEGQADISTILENANMNKWSYEEEKRTHRRSAISDLASANASVFKAQSLNESAADARNAAVQQMDNAQQSAAETIAYGNKAAKAARKSGRRGAWGAVLKGVADVGLGGYQMFGK